ncbi:hypothetical protein AVEN_38296-1 [Araneus ventricosus]|uniref:Uncharacterized protein n=1 Tax=Araneus ventricosus TaxID=182803 RepID=A0A4Y2E4K3_ARAVE|nr:hypothetical protein AVEN_38296-1 [Araneus ventricosus]
MIGVYFTPFIHLNMAHERVFNLHQFSFVIDLGVLTKCQARKEDSKCSVSFIQINRCLVSDKSLIADDCNPYQQLICQSPSRHLRGSNELLNA